MKDSAIPKGLIKEVDVDKPQFKGFQSIRKLFWKYLNLLGVPFNDPCCPTASTATGGSGLLSATVTLTDAQIKALPSQTVTLVSAPGVGKGIVPISCTCIADIEAAPYIIPAGAGLHLLFNELYASSIMKVDLLLGTSNYPIGQFSVPFSFPGSGDYNGTNVSGVAFDKPDWENRSLDIGDVWNAVSDYTGGNSANTLKVVVYYVVVDL